MSTPIVLSILLNMQAALQGITTASGYFYDVKATSVVLDPVSLDTVPGTEVPYFVLDKEEDGTMNYNTSRSGVLGAVENLFVVPIRARVDAPGTDGSRKRTAAWQLYADIEKALTADPFRGGPARYTRIKWPAFYFGLATQNIVYVEVPVHIELQRAYGQP